MCTGFRVKSSQRRDFVKITLYFEYVLHYETHRWGIPINVTIFSDTNHIQKAGLVFDKKHLNSKIL